MQVSIFRGKELVKVVRLPDPREAFCKAFNSLASGLTAKPHPKSRATRLASSRRGSE